MIAETTTTWDPAVEWVPPISEDQAKLYEANVYQPSTARPLIDAMVSRIEPQAVSQIVGRVFEDLLRLLDCMDLIQSHLREVDQADETLVLYQLIYAEAHSLLAYIKDVALSNEALDQNLSETLDGIAFAVEHDVKRAFEGSMHGPGPTRSSEAVVGAIIRSHDVLTNCLQQSTISLALVFDSSLVGAKLFNNSATRLRESLKLCEDLAELIQIMDWVENNSSLDARVAMIEAVMKFRSEGMQFLMYSDWPEFERFCGKITSSCEDSKPEALYHQFRCYLETLLGQVKMRAVFADASRDSVTIQCHEQEMNPPANVVKSAAPARSSAGGNFKSFGQSLWSRFRRVELAA